MKRIFISIISALMVLSINACVYTTKKAFLDFQNDSSSQITVSSKINKEAEYSEDFKLEPGKSELFYMYEETPGKEESVFDSFNEVRITNAEGCEIILNKNDIRDLAKRSGEGYRWTVYIRDGEFIKAGCAK
jgi:hypothetical protein